MEKEFRCDTLNVAMKEEYLAGYVAVRCGIEVMLDEAPESK